MSTTTPAVKKEISGKQILTLLQAGHPRYKKDVEEGGLNSVEEQLEISASELRVFLKHPKLANFRFRPIVALVDDFGDDTPVLVDDFDAPTPTPAETPVTEDVAPDDVLEAIMDTAAAEEAELFS